MHMGIFFRDDDDNNEEEYTGQTGDPIHDAIYGWDLGSGSSSDDDHIEETGGGPAIDFAERNSYAKKAWDYYMDFKEEEALHYIDLALDLDRNYSKGWNIYSTAALTHRWYFMPSPSFATLSFQTLHTLSRGHATAWTRCI